MHSANQPKKRQTPSPEARTLKQLTQYGKAASGMSIYQEMSTQVLTAMTSMRNLVVLHVQPEGFPDHLLRLHILLQTIGSLRSYNLKEGRDIPLGAVVVVDSLDSNDCGFKQACWVAGERHNHGDGTKVLGGAAYIFGKCSNFAVVQGLNLKKRTYGSATSRLIQAIKNVMRSAQATGVVWHECASVALLAHALNDVHHGRELSKDLLKAICATNGLSFDSKTGCTVKSGFRDPKSGRSLLSSVERLDIPLLFLDANILGLPAIQSQTQSLNTSTSWIPLANHLPFFSAHWPRLLPSAAWTPLLRQGMDTLATSIFRLRAMIEGALEKAVVNQVKKELSYKHAQNWATNVVKTSSYTSTSCDSMQDNLANELWQMYLNAISPVNFPLDALFSGVVDQGRKFDSSMMALRVDVDLRDLP